MLQFCLYLRFSQQFWIYPSIHFMWIVLEQLGQPLSQLNSNTRQINHVACIVVI